MAQNVMTKEEIDSLIKDYQTGMRVYELSEKYNRTSSTIIARLRKCEVFQPVSKGWTKEQEQYLVDNYGAKTAKEIADHLGINVSNVYSKASKLKCHPVDYHWSEEDIQLLQYLFEQGCSNKKIAQAFDGKYTSGAIATKRQKLGLVDNRSWTNEEMNILKDNYNLVDYNTLHNLLPKRSHSQILAKARKMGLYSDHFWSDDEIQYLKDSWQTVGDRDMATYLNRPWRSVKAKRNELKLFREKEFAIIESLSDLLRSSNSTWVRKSAEACNHKCILTGDDYDDVHHTYAANFIIKETLEYCNLEMKEYSDYTANERKFLRTEFRRIQNQYGLGVCLRKDVHKLFHSLYGVGFNTPEQFEEFTQRFKSGEFNDRLNHPVE